MTNVFYLKHINKIGGIETFIYEIAKRFNDYDITVCYSSGDVQQITRLQKLVNVEKYDGQKIKCKRIFFNYAIDIIDNVEAEEYIQIIHADFNSIPLKPILHKKITKYIAVSELSAKSFEEITGIKAEVVYNPIEIRKPKRILKLISLTRLTAEKGKERIEKLAKILENNNIPYEWDIYTDYAGTIQGKNINYKKTVLNAIDYIAKADYLVQLSDEEAYGYSIVESLIVGTPVIVTNMKVLKELGVENGINGYIVDKQLDTVPIDDIYNNELRFSYMPPKDNWEEYVIKEKSNYKEELKKMKEVECLVKFVDKKENRIREKGEKWLESQDRINEILLIDTPEGKLIKVVEEKKLDTEKEPKTGKKAKKL